MLIGGGAVASSRLYFLLESDAHITIVSPKLDPTITARLDTNGHQITWIKRKYVGVKEDEIDLTKFHMVMTAIDDNPLSESICLECRAKGVLVNIADVPPMCDFYFAAQFRRGPLQVMLSTGGMGPRIGALVRDRVEKALPPNLEDAIVGVGELRKDLRKRAPGVGGALGQKRMDWMKSISETWTLEELEDLNKADVRSRVLDEGWDKEMVVRPGEVGAGASTLSRLAPLYDWTLPGGILLGATIGSLVTMMLVRQK